MAIVITNLLDEADTTGGDPVTTAGSVTTVAGRAYLVTVQCSVNVAVSSVTLPGSLSCTSIGSTTRGSLFTISYYWAVASGGNTGTVTVDFASATTGTVIIVDEAVGAHATTPIVAGSFVSANGAAATTATVTMGAFANALNAGYFSAGINATDAITPELGWTELGQGSYVTPSRNTLSQWMIGGTDLSPSCTFVSNQWAAGAFEIAIAASSPQTASVTGLGSATAFGTVTIIKGNVGVSVSGLTSAASFGTVSASTGSTNVAITGLGSAAAFGVLAKVNYTIFIVGLSSAASFGTLTISTGNVNVSVTGPGSAAVFGSLSVSGGTPGLTGASDTRRMMMYKGK